MKLEKWIILGICTIGLMALNNCKEEIPYVHNYKGDWGYCEDFNCIEFIFEDSINTHLRYIVDGPCNPLLDSKSYISVEEFDDGVIKITQDSCFKYEYNYSILDSYGCDSLTSVRYQSEIIGNIIQEYDWLMKWKVFYLKYYVEGDIMKVKYYLHPEEIKPGFDGTVYNFFRITDDDERFN